MRNSPITKAESILGQDCTSFTRVPHNSYQYFSSIYPQQLLEVAQNNLWNYCCKYESKVIPREMMSYCTDHATKDYVKSPWLFDQLVDVGFRYLDGVQSLQYENAPLDAKGKERREKIEALGINIQ